MMRWMRVTALLAALCLLAVGCSASPGNVPEPAPTMETEEMPLSPEAPIVEVQHQYTLYFGLSDESYLASEARLVTVPQGGRVEDALVAALIRGPGVSTTQLVGVINPQTKIVRIEESQDYLYITLSREFLEPVYPVTEENLSPERQEALRMRMMMLATYSIVNTVTELGRYSRVQILIDYDNSGEGTRPSRTMLGLSPAGEPDADSMVSTLARQDSLVLNPKNTAELLMKAFVEKNWTRAEKFCALYDSQTDTARPAKEDLIAQLTLQNPDVLSYQVKVQNVSVDGQNAVVMVDVQMRSKAGTTVSGTDIPLRFLREDGIWKLSYSSMELLFNTVG